MIINHRYDRIKIEKLEFVGEDNLYTAKLSYSKANEQYRCNERLTHGYRRCIIVAEILS